MLTMLTTRLFTNSLPTIASLCLLALPSASATVITVGDMNPPSDVGPSDGWDAVFLFSTPLSAPNASEVFGTVTQFEFWAETGTTNRNITPLLFSSADAGAS